MTVSPVRASLAGRRPRRSNVIVLLMGALLILLTARHDDGKSAARYDAKVSPWDSSSNPQPPPFDEFLPESPDRHWPLKVFERVACPSAPICRVVGNTVAIEASSQNEVTGHATGFVVRSGLIVTVAHAVRHFGESDQLDLQVYCHGDRRIGRLLTINDLHDTAVLAADCDGETLTVGDTTPPVETTVWITGIEFIDSSNYSYRLSHDLAYRFLATASVSNASLLEPGFDRRRFVPSLLRRLESLKSQGQKMPYGVTTLTASGNSGSPACLDDGTVVGMASVRSPAKRMSFMVPAEHLQMALKSIVDR
ncbi:MAG: trypsin-like peptidase domain-containing protein [Patescibacteria group bacterium]|nr:trypsin-like peptidase domain-containing protein [Patescibacteria group bacterium]